VFGADSEHLVACCIAVVYCLGIGNFISNHSPGCLLLEGFIPALVGDACISSFMEIFEHLDQGGMDQLPIQHAVGLIAGILAFVVRPMIEELVFRFVPDKLLWHCPSSLSTTTTTTSESIKNADELSQNASMPVITDNREEFLYFISTFLFAVAHMVKLYGQNAGFVVKMMKKEIDSDALEQLRQALYQCVSAYELAWRVYHPLYQHSSVWASFGANACWNFLMACLSFICLKVANIIK
jgi:membrane protease YdiL (CAAX protease family)